MTDIKRYKSPHDHYEHAWRLTMQEDPQGNWVRWDDVKDLLDLARDAVTLEVIRKFEKPTLEEPVIDASEG